MVEHVLQSESHEEDRFEGVKSLANLLEDKLALVEQWTNLSHKTEYVKRTDVHPIMRWNRYMHVPFQNDLAQVEAISAYVDTLNQELTPDELFTLSQDEANSLYHMAMVCKEAGAENGIPRELAQRSQEMVRTLLLCNRSYEEKHQKQLWYFNLGVPVIIEQLNEPQRVPLGSFEDVNVALKLLEQRLLISLDRTDPYASVPKGMHGIVTEENRRASTGKSWNHHLDLLPKREEAAKLLAYFSRGNKLRPLIKKVARLITEIPETKGFIPASVRFEVPMLDSKFTATQQRLWDGLGLHGIVGLRSIEKACDKFKQKITTADWDDLSVVGLHLVKTLQQTELFLPPDDNSQNKSLRFSQVEIEQFSHSLQSFIKEYHDSEKQEKKLKEAPAYVPFFIWMVFITALLMKPVEFAIEHFPYEEVGEKISEVQENTEELIKDIRTGEAFAEAAPDPNTTEGKLALTFLNFIPGEDVISESLGNYRGPENDGREGLDAVKEQDARYGALEIVTRNPFENGNFLPRANLYWQIGSDDPEKPFAISFIAPEMRNFSEIKGFELNRVYAETIAFDEFVKDLDTTLSLQSRQDIHSWYSELSEAILNDTAMIAVEGVRFQPKYAEMIHADQAIGDATLVRIPVYRLEHRQTLMYQMVTVIDELEGNLKVELLIDSNGQHFLKIPHTGNDQVVVFYEVPHGEDFSGVVSAWTDDNTAEWDKVVSIPNQDLVWYNNVNTFEETNLTAKGVELLGLDSTFAQPIAIYNDFTDGKNNKTLEDLQVFYEAQGIDFKKINDRSWQLYYEKTVDSFPDQGVDFAYNIPQDYSDGLDRQTSYIRAIIEALVSIGVKYNADSRGNDIIDEDDARTYLLAGKEVGLDCDGLSLLVGMIYETAVRNNAVNNFFFDGEYLKPTLLVGTMDVNGDRRFAQAPNHAVLALNSQATVYVDVVKYFPVVEGGATESGEDATINSLVQLLAEFGLEKTAASLVAALALIAGTVTMRRIAIELVKEIKRLRWRKYSSSRNSLESRKNQSEDIKIDRLLKIITPELKKLTTAQLATVMYGLKYIFGQRFDGSVEQIDEQYLEGIFSELTMHSHIDTREFYASVPSFMTSLQEELKPAEVKQRSRVARKTLGKYVTSSDEEMRPVYKVLRKFTGLLSLM